MPCAWGIPTKPRLVRVLKHLWQHLGGRRDAWLPNTMLAEALALQPEEAKRRLSPLYHHTMTHHHYIPLHITNLQHTLE